MNIVIETILKKFSEFCDHDFDNINWDDGTHLKIPYNTPNGESEMIQWLTNYLYNLKINELREITEYPYILRRRKKECKKFANNFVFMYGFTSYDNNIKVIRSRKINNLIKNI
jgi:UDP-2,3-diacylglucosamine pyrophosphatase LpxH